MSIYSLTKTDLYQLTMSAGYYSHNKNQTATFELYVRRLPKHRSFLVSAGLEQAIEYLTKCHFSNEEIDYLKGLEIFTHISDHFFDYLKNFKFTGDLWAMPEGTIFFPYEPIIRITAPLIEAQIIETYLLSLLNYQTSVASKAARIALACQSKKGINFVDFGSRRAHGPEAGGLAARAAYIGGASASSNVNAGLKYGLPIVGTAAHAWTMAFENEPDAFQKYKAVFPQHTTLLIDTYDTLQGAKNAIQTAGKELKGVRLDSGDFLSLSKDVRQLLDAAELKHTKIVASGDMNETKIKALLTAEAPIDTFGVGTELVTSIDAPSLGGVYKMVELLNTQGQPSYKIKLSSSKISYPGKKQVYRKHWKDTIALDSHPLSGQALLKPIIINGKQVYTCPALAEIQSHLKTQLDDLPEKFKVLDEVPDSPVTIDNSIMNLFETTKQNTQKGALK